MRSSKNTNYLEEQIPRITIEEIDSVEDFKNLSTDEKLELISLIYEISLALYNSYKNSDEGL
jgi:hypothetical protein